MDDMDNGQPPWTNGQHGQAAMDKHHGRRGQ